MKEPAPERRPGASRRQKPREVQAYSARKQWREQKEARQKELFALYIRNVKTFDIYGKPLAKGDMPDADVRGEDVALGLERAYAATGDPIFADALAALREYGLAGGKPRASHATAQKVSWGDHYLGYLQQMRWLVENRKSSIRAAADDVAAKFFVDGNTFNSVTKKLRERYGAWERSGFPEEEITDRGNVGYYVVARPVNGKRVIDPFEKREMPMEGVVVPFTTYWRRRFAAGDIEISRSEIGRKLS